MTAIAMKSKGPLSVTEIKRRFFVLMFCLAFMLLLLVLFDSWGDVLKKYIFGEYLFHAHVVVLFSVMMAIIVLIYTILYIIISSIKYDDVQFFEVLVAFKGRLIVNLCCQILTTFLNCLMISTEDGLQLQEYYLGVYVFTVKVVVYCFYLATMLMTLGIFLHIMITDRRNSRSGSQEKSLEVSSLESTPVLIPEQPVVVVVGNRSRYEPLESTPVPIPGELVAVA